MSPRVRARGSPGERAPTARIALALACALCALDCATPKPSAEPNSGFASDPGPTTNTRPPQPAGQTREVTAREMRIVRGLMDAAERVRGLRFERPVPVLVQDANAIMAYVDSQIESEELERARTVYTALGLLPPELDVHALLLRLMGEQVVGYYDLDGHRLVIRDDVMEAFAGKSGSLGVDVNEARVVLVHELVHALQDQRLGLAANVEKKRDSDGESAFRALIEGDATLAMIAFAYERDAASLSDLTSDPASVRSLSTLVRSSPLAGSELGGAPAIVRVPLLSAYVDGLSLAANLHGDGGWGRVDRAHTEPPVSTEQVLHPERFVHHDMPIRVRLPNPKTLLDSDYELVHEDTLGELELGVYFSLGANEDAAARDAVGWGGDRLYAYRNANAQVAVIWLTAWDDQAHAQRALRAAERVRAAAGIEQRSQQLVLRAGRAVLIARNVPEPLQSTVRDEFLRWATEAGLDTKPVD